MSQGIGVVGVYVRDQEEALAFYVDKVGFRVCADVTNGPFRWLTVQHAEQPDVQLGLFSPGPPLHDPHTERALRELLAKGAMPGLVLYVDDCVATYERLQAAGVEVTQAPTERFGQVDADFRDPSGNAWKLIQRARGGVA
jgi:catechol 2,3-dioxygenase-like lactoylglutathione lyase family enzyme